MFLSDCLLKQLLAQKVRFSTTRWVSGAYFDEKKAFARENCRIYDKVLHPRRESELMMDTGKGKAVLSQRQAARKQLRVEASFRR